MACYAAVLSLYHTLNNINIHPRPPISLDQEQLQSLTQNLTFFQHFLESYPTYEDDDLETRIKAAAYAAEDVIETHIVDQIHAGSTSHGENISSVYFQRGLDRMIGDMDLIKKEVMEVMIKEKTKGSQHHRPHTYSSVPTASAGPAFAGQTSIMARLDDALIVKVLDKLTGQQSNLQIIPIVGMGGIGKTTLAKYIYSNPLIVEHFYIRAWVTISQEYSRRNILQLLCQEINESINGLSEDKLGEKIYKKLWGRRYLIVMDDIWTAEALDKVRCFFPNNDNGSRIMITTRLSNLAFELSGSHDFHVQFLDEDNSWDLFCKIVFGKLDCPIELKDIGKKIARNCRGLPLSIAVIGGLLRKSNMTRVHWEYSLHHLNSLVNLEDNEYCLQVLLTSYRELPIHLKPCFLYIGVFPEDSEINVSRLIKLWVSEGILKPNDDKSSLEAVAEEYLKELIERNLILVHKLQWNGEAKICKVHDLLRDVCLREAKKQKFLCVLRQQKHHIPQGINMERRICIDIYEEYSPQFLRALESASLTRSLFYYDPAWYEDFPSPRLGLLRVYSPVNRCHTTHSNNAIFEYANLRYFSPRLELEAVSRLPSLCSLLWNLQTLKVDRMYPYELAMAPSEIWEMPLLRHVTLPQVALPDPSDGEDNFVLENFQTLSGVLNFKFSEEVVKRIPGIKKLNVDYDRFGYDDGELPNFYFNNIGLLQQLESLSLKLAFIGFSYPVDDGRNLVSFPNSLKKLTLLGTMLSWEDLNIRVGSLPLLQVLTLGWGACDGPEWVTLEGKFSSLKILQIDGRECKLKYWETDNSSFQLLEHLHLEDLKELEEIPSDIGEILTLKSIRLVNGSKSAQDSAERIKDEKVANGNEELQVIIGMDRTNLVSFPFLKKLSLHGTKLSLEELTIRISHLQKLESLNLEVPIVDHCDLGKEFDEPSSIGRNLMSFPHSLKKVSLIGTKLNWEELTIGIGSLPFLQFLKLKWDACVGPRWETLEGQFCWLRVLEIKECYDLKYWETDSSHFPCLERLSLFGLTKLEEIPSSIGDIPTLKCIKLERCSASASDSAKVIKEEQEENGNEDLQVVVIDPNLDKDHWGVEDEEDEQD